jgi:hypothetical protein
MASSPTPWAITNANQISTALAITAADGSVVVTFPKPGTTTTLVGGLLTTVLSAVGQQQAQLNLDNAQLIVDQVNAKQTVIDTLNRLRTAIDPSFNRIMPLAALRKTVYTIVQDTITKMTGG